MVYLIPNKGSGYSGFNAKIVTALIGDAGFRAAQRAAAEAVAGVAHGFAAMHHRSGVHEAHIGIRDVPGNRIDIEVYNDAP